MHKFGLSSFHLNHMFLIGLKNVRALPSVLKEKKKALK